VEKDSIMSTSVASVVAHFPSAENGFATTASSAITAGDTTVQLASISGYEDGEVVVFVVDPDDTNLKQTFTGVLDTATLSVTGVVWTAGTNQNHALGATIVDYASATHISMISKGLSVEHNQDGTHSDVTATSLTTDVISEATPANGVTIDSLNVKDGKLNTNDSVVTANITDDAVTAAKIETQEAWIAPTLLNSWVNYDGGSTYNIAGYMKDSLGFVHLRGMVKSGTDESIIFTLPAGYRPEYRELRVIISADLVGRCDITTAGSVDLSISTNTWVSLDGIIFKAYQ
jgi:hypothetical protein